MDNALHAGMDEFPRFRKEHLTGAYRNRLIQNKMVGAPACQKVFALVDFISLKKKINLSAKEARTKYSDLDVALDVFHDNENGLPQPNADKTPWRNNRKKNSRLLKTN